MTLHADNVTLARGGVPVLTGLSFTLPAGTALIVRGPNGVGKTTLLRTVAGLQDCLMGQITGTEGRIAYAGHADGLKAMLSVYWKPHGPFLSPRIKKSSMYCRRNTSLTTRTEFASQ